MKCCTGSQLFPRTCQLEDFASLVDRKQGAGQPAISNPEPNPDRCRAKRLGQVVAGCFEGCEERDSYLDLKAFCAFGVYFCWLANACYGERLLGGDNEGPKALFNKASCDDVPFSSL